jgi:hypothetical protein
LSYHSYQYFQGLHIVNSNYLISDTSWDGLAAEWRSKLYGIEEIELRTTTFSYQLLFISPSHFLMPVFPLFFFLQWPEWDLYRFWSLIAIGGFPWLLLIQWLGLSCVSFQLIHWLESTLDSSRLLESVKLSFYLLHCHSFAPVGSSTFPGPSRIF